MKKVLVYTGSRANYSSTRPIIRAFIRHPFIQPLVVVGGPGLLPKYGDVSGLMTNDGITVDATFLSQVEGETPSSMAISTGLGIIQSASILDNLSPDLVLVVGDRYDVISFAIASAFMNIPLVHTMGGEISGTIDESIRHAITKFANLHFPANHLAASRILSMGEEPSSVHVVGCPRIDEVSDIIRLRPSLSSVIESVEGVGTKPSCGAEEFILVSCHPVTTQYGQNRQAMDNILMALGKIRLPTILLWPNSDAGSNEISKSIRTYRENFDPDWLFVCGNLKFETYIALMSYCACLVGNSSSGVRESCFIGTPVVNVGNRQNGRDRPCNVVDSTCEVDDLFHAILSQVQAKTYPRSALYGNGTASQNIADVIARLSLSTTQKTFIDS